AFFEGHGAIERPATAKAHQQLPAREPAGAIYFEGPNQQPARQPLQPGQLSFEALAVDRQGLGEGGIGAPGAVPPATVAESDQRFQYLARLGRLAAGAKQVAGQFRVRQVSGAVAREADGVAEQPEDIAGGPASLEKALHQLAVPVGHNLAAL